jgi:formamidopyrimidine-DNA glycosylase
MPELPEVENVRRSLQRLVAGRRVVRVEVRLARIVRSPAPEAFARAIAGETIERVDRRGKYLLLRLGARTLVSHLRMEGRFGLHDVHEPELLHTHVVFDLDGEQQLRYRDVRQFGTMDLLSTDVADAWPQLHDLGPEPIEESCDAAYLYARTRGRATPIKAMLLDQRVVAGIGNIYADETLHRAGVHPALPAGRTSRVQCARIVDAARAILTQAIALGGSSVKSFVDGDGQRGGYQYALAVYGREGQACVTCGAPIVKLRVAGRGTHLCPACQRVTRRRPAR